MTVDAIRDEIRTKLGATILDLELDDSSLDKVINSAFREIQRYIDTTKLATIQYKPCIDLSDCGVSSVSRVFRARSYLGDENYNDPTSIIDPIYASQWQLMSGNGLYNMQNWTYNYAAWNTMLQIRNTLSTDLTFRFDRHTNYLYINVAYDKPQFITIEYVPRYNDVSEIVSDYWIDKLILLACALTKVTIGRIRSRYTQSNALWTQDGETLLEEGNQELAEIREALVTNTQLFYPMD